MKLKRARGKVESLNEEIEKGGQIDGHLMKVLENGG